MAVSSVGINARSNTFFPLAASNLIDSLAEEGDLEAALSTIDALIGHHSAPNQSVLHTFYYAELSGEGIQRDN